MSKKYKGHYCKICNSLLSNESFSGKGHENHICKKCSSLSSTEKNNKMDENRLFKLYEFSNLSKNNRKILEKYRNDSRENIQKLANEIYDFFHGEKDYKIIDYEEEYEIKNQHNTNEEYSDSYEESEEFLYRVEEDFFTFPSKKNRRF